MKQLLTFFIACTIVEAIQIARPKAEWTLQGNKYSGLVWLDKTQSKPTKDELATAMQTCQSNQIAMSQAVLDAKDSTKTPQQRLDALMKVLNLQ